MKNKKITVFGSGNIGTQFACVASSKGYEVLIYSSKPEKINNHLYIVDSENNPICEGSIKKSTNSIEEAMKADIVFVTHPAFMFPDDAEKMLPYIKSGMIIVAVPGTGGAEFAFKKCIEKGAILCGIQRVPAVARLVEYGKTVCVEGKRECLYLGAIPPTKAVCVSELMAELFDMKCEILPNYLCVTMTPSNPILHTSRLATMFEDYEEGMIYDRIPLFYGEWSDKSSERLLACDKEHQALLEMLDKMDLSTVKSLVEHYDHSDTKEKMTSKIQSIKSLHNLVSPQKRKDDGWIPDFQSRYFTADFPYGLAIIEDFADILGVEAKNITKTMNWYRKVTGNDSKYELNKYGIKNIGDIYNYYL